MRRVISMQVGDNHYLFAWDANDPRQQEEILRTLGRFASNPELNFTWYAAMQASAKVRQAVYERVRR